MDMVENGRSMTKAKMHAANALDPNRPSLLLVLMNEVTKHEARLGYSERCILTLIWVRFRGDPEINQPMLLAHIV